MIFCLINCKSYVCRWCYNCTCVRGGWVFKYTPHLGCTVHPLCFHILDIYIFYLMHIFLDKRTAARQIWTTPFTSDSMRYIFKVLPKAVPTLGLYISPCSQLFLKSKLRHPLPKHIKLVYIINCNNIVKNAVKSPYSPPTSLSLSVNFEVHAWFGPCMNIHKAYHRPALCSVNETFEFGWIVLYVYETLLDMTTFSWEKW